MFKHRVPFSSQKGPTLDQNWQHRACGVSSLKMLLDFWFGKLNIQKDINPQELVDEGTEMGAYIPGTGWLHAGLVKLAKKYDLDGYNKDLSAKDFESAFSELTNELEKHPVIVSIKTPNGGHLVVATGLDPENRKLFINDPAATNESEGRQEISFAKFQEIWTKRFIAVHPKN